MGNFPERKKTIQNLPAVKKNIVGYWRVENNGKEYKLLFQSGRITTYARFDGTNIFFDKQDNLLDSVFSQAIFTKAAK